MIGDILNAILAECQAFLSDSTGNPSGGGTVILKTDFRNDHERTYSMPLILLDMIDGSDSRQFIGGGSALEWNFAFNSYNIAPDAYAGDVNLEGYSADLLDVIDRIRQHFSFGQWLTEQMIGIVDNYGFRFTFGGINRADALEGDGVVMGWRLHFESMAIDNTTNFVVPSSSGLEQVIQVGGVEVVNE